jgi:hypothetical protein
MEEGGLSFGGGENDCSCFSTLADAIRKTQGKRESTDGETKS